MKLRAGLSINKFLRGIRAGRKWKYDIMANDDMTELQTIMAGASDPISRDPHPPKKPRNEDMPTISQSPTPEVRMDLCQWQVFPNDNFVASSPTSKSLPPGVYNLEEDSSGRIFFVKTKPITDKLIDLGETTSARVVESIEIFWNSRQQFIARGIIFKRGILLWGPAGSGKTATVAQLIERLISRGGIVVICQYPNRCILALRILRRIEHIRPLIVIMEDIEEMIDNHGEHDLLSLLDGEHQVDNVVHLATTNYPERLGPRIINRPSRFDEVIKVPMPNLAARYKYLSYNLDGKVSDPQLQEWADQTNNLSIAHLRELIVATQCLSRPFDETLDRLKKMVIRPRSSEGTSHPGMV